MSNIFKVKAGSDFPKAGSTWHVDLEGGTPEQQLAYANLGYALIGKSMVRLGVAMSEAITGDDSKMNLLKKEVE
jgi:hypothetical protein